jgi:uncharacterized protein with GYD domain
MLVQGMSRKVSKQRWIGREMEEKMPLFITYASYSNAGIKGIIDKPIDRTEPIRTLVEKAGGKLVAAYKTTGPHDVVIVRPRFARPGPYPLGR